MRGPYLKHDSSHLSRLLAQRKSRIHSAQEKELERSSNRLKATSQTHKSHKGVCRLWGGKIARGAVAGPFAVEKVQSNKQHFTDSVTSLPHCNFGTFTNWIFFVELVSWRLHFLLAFSGHGILRSNNPAVAWMLQNHAKTTSKNGYLLTRWPSRSRLHFVFGRLDICEIDVPP